MQISITYEPNATELAKASSLFIEKKPFMLFIIGFINTFGYLILLLLIVKLLVVKSLTPNESLAGISACAWIFGRRPFNQWLLKTRMKNTFLLHNPLTIDVSLNGLAWHGKKIRSESMKWGDIAFAFETKNGFVLPNAFSKFLWLPFRGFKSPAEIDAFRQMIIDRKIALKAYPKWEC